MLYTETLTFLTDACAHLAGICSSPSYLEGMKITCNCLKTGEEILYVPVPIITARHAIQLKMNCHHVVQPELMQNKASFSTVSQLAAQMEDSIVTTLARQILGS